MELRRKVSNVTKEEMLEEARYLVDTDNNVREGFEHAQDPNQIFTYNIPQYFDYLFNALTYDYNANDVRRSIGYWYGRIVNPNRPKDM